MNNRMLLLTLLGLGLMIAPGTVSALAPCQAQGGASFKVLNVVWGNSTHFVSAGPGQSDVPLTVSVESYSYGCTITNVEGILSLYGGIANFNGSNEAVYYTASASPSSIINMLFNLNIASNTTAGPGITVTYPLYIYWNSTNGTVRYNNEINLVIPLKGSGQPVYNVASHALPTGSLENFTLTVTNAGSGVLSNIATTLSASGLSVIQQPQTISTLGPGASTNVSAYVYAASTSTGAPLSMDVNTHYISPYGYNTTLDSTLGLYTLATQTPPVSIGLSNTSLTTGGVRSEDIIVLNSGTYPLFNVSADISPGSGMSLIGSDGYVSFPTVPAGGSAEMPVTLYLSSSSSTVGSIGVVLSYVTDGQSESVSRTVSLLTPGSVNLTQVSTTVLPAHPTPGAIFTLTSTLNNGGSVSASAATATAHPPAGITVLGTSSTYIGSISTGTPTAYTLSFTVASSASAGEYKIPVMLSYLNNLDQRINTTYEYSVNVSGAGGTVLTTSTGNSSVRTSGNYPAYAGRGSGLLITVVIIVVVVAAAGGGYYVYSKRRKSRTAQKQDTPRKEGRGR